MEYHNLIYEINVNWYEPEPVAIKLCWIECHAPRRMGNKLAFWKRGGGDPDTAWKEQNKEQKQNPLYQLINLQKEGDLINIYENEGPEALRKFMDDNIEKLLYNNGAGKIVTKADYFRWKNRGKTKVSQNLFIFLTWVINQD